MGKSFTFDDSVISPIKRNRMPLLLSVFSLLLLLCFLYFYYIYPGAGLGPEQPIPFSHRLHVSVKQIQCHFCHPFVDRSTFPGVPPVEKCLYCHKYIIANHPEIVKEHRYFNTGTPTPWRKVNYLAEHVLFNHQRHIKKEIACETCHGEVKTMDRLNDRHFKMGFCIDCHREKKANLDCWLACHS